MNNNENQLPKKTVQKLEEPKPKPKPIIVSFQTFSEQLPKETKKKKDDN